MKPTKFHIAILIFILFSCRTKSGSDKISIVQIRTHPDTSVKSIQFSLLDTLIVNTKDTFTYNHRTFRILKHSQSKDVEIQYWENNKWKDNIQVHVYDQFETDFDVNKDGYKDIFSQAQGFNYVNFYIPSKRLFSEQFQLFADDEIVVDSVRKIYANYREAYHACNNYSSQLFDYKNSTPHYYYLLTGETECEMGNIKTIKLYKHDNINDSLILLSSFKSKDTSNLDYEKYWKKNYKRLMGYHQHGVLCKLGFTE
ncbi:MAG: hypothetical protein QM535_18405 [Limnohabitans sp.]|nr:hypothetical protein [Limnohabitans sp.]